MSKSESDRSPWENRSIFETYVVFHVSSKSAEKVELSWFLKDQTNTNMLCPLKYTLTCTRVIAVITIVSTLTESDRAFSPFVC